MQQLNKRYPLGAHLIVKHLGYSHHGIYAGRGRVIHYSGLAHFIKKRPIEITSIDAFSHGKKIHVRSYDKPRYKGKIVVRRMRSRMHENHYHLIINNCEHLCSWAITGIEDVYKRQGMDDYPVFTRKVHTDLSYIACAKKLLAAPEFIYPQFATHNAQTLATIYHLADPSKYYAGQYEFQCLHGMGEPLYEQVVGPREQNKLGVPCRIYAPVGNHETLLAYLVRRLLENGANTSFVNRIADKTLKVEDLIQSPIYDIRHAAKLEGSVGLKHPSIPLPLDMYGTLRKNSKGCLLYTSLLL